MQAIFLKLAEDTIGEADLVLLPAALPVTVAANAMRSAYSCDGSAGCLSYDQFQSTTNGSTNGSSLAPGTALALPLLNSTEVEQAVATVGSAAGAAPRWLLLGSLLNAKERSRNTSVLVLALDSEAEDRMDLGRQWGRRPLGYLEAYAVRYSDGWMDGWNP